MPFKKRIFLIVAILYVLYIVFPLFKDVLGIPVWLPSLATFITLLVIYPQAFGNKTFYWFLVYAVFLALYVVLGMPLTIGIGSVAAGKMLLIEYAFILPCISIFSVLSFLNDVELSRKILKWSVAILFISFIVAIPLMLRFNSLRDALLDENQEDVNIAGLPSYGLMHSYTLFLPVLCYCVKVYKGNQRLFSFIGLIVLCFVIYDTFVTTSLLLMIVILLFTILHSDKNIQKSFIIMAALALLFFLLYETGFFVSLIDLIMPAFEGTAVKPKLIDMRDSMIQGHVTGDSLTARQDLHALSVNSFLNNPLFGGSKVGGHSSLMDRLGGMGLFVGFPFIMIIISFVKRANKLYKTTMAKSFLGIGIVVGFMYLYNKGNWGAENWLFYMVLLPIGLLVAENFNLQNYSKHLR